MTTTDVKTAAAPESDGGILPPYSGPETHCAKCSHPGAYTRHRRAVPGRVLVRDETTDRLRRGPLPERLERQCERCDYTWDEDLCPPGCGMTVAALAHAVDNATAYPLELLPRDCEIIAEYLLSCLHISARPDHPLWQYDAGVPGPTVQPEPSPADSETTR